MSFKSFTKTRLNSSQHPNQAPELLLYSSAHSRLDHIVREEASNGSESHLKHYIGVYDPQSNNLHLIPANNLVLRSTLRSTRKEREDEDDTEAANTMSARSRLGLAFGTKKSQKAIHAMTANAIQPSPSKNRNTSVGENESLDAVAAAVMSSMPSTAAISTREEMQAQIDEGKPRPKANLQAETPAEVYAVEDLVGGESVLANIGVKEWIDIIQAGRDIQTKSVFVSRRLQATIKSGDVRRVKILKYILLLVEWFKALKAKGKGGWRVPKFEDMGSLEESWGSDIVKGLDRRFAEAHTLNTWHQDNLIIHILALAIVFDNFATDTSDMRADLKLEVKDVGRYYKELGCVVAAPTEIERNNLGFTKTEAGSHRIAKLRLPLVFPKMRIPASARRKK